MQYRVYDKNHMLIKNYTNISDGNTITGLNAGDLVEVCFVDGMRRGESATLEITDDTPPTADLSVESGYTKITINVTATDEESGIKEYRYYISGSEVSRGTDLTTYTYTGLMQGTDYDITVEVIDKAENITPLATQVRTNLCPDCNGTLERIGPCEFCNNGMIEESCQNYCNNGIISRNCDYCYGKGTIQCGDCSSTGIGINFQYTITCAECEGMSYIKSPCYKCNGEGEVKVPCSKGTTKADCPSCMGTGCDMCNQAGVIYQCTSCMGTGCDMCDNIGTFYQCNDCKGSGYDAGSTCNTCNGNGWTGTVNKCISCRGSGYDDMGEMCNTCNGTGKCQECSETGYVIETCGTCQGGGFIEVPCSSCGGNGCYYVTTSLCNYCYGSGCEECNNIGAIGQCSNCYGSGCDMCNYRGTFKIRKNYFEGFCMYASDEKESQCDISQCFTCVGTGQVDCPQCEGGTINEQCQNCGGNGIIITTCTNCYGTGIINLGPCTTCQD